MMRLRCLLRQRQVVERHLRVQDVVEDHAADGGEDQPVRLARQLLDDGLVLLDLDLADDLLLDRQADADLGVHAELAARRRRVNSSAGLWNIMPSPASIASSSSPRLAVR